MEALYTSMRTPLAPLLAAAALALLLAGCGGTTQVVKGAGEAASKAREPTEGIGRARRAACGRVQVRQASDAARGRATEDVPGC